MRNHVRPLLLLLAMPCIAIAQAPTLPFPTKPIRLIVPFPPGGSTTIVSRLYSQKLIDAWGQQIVVDNRGGGNTIIGSEAMVKAAPDGYTWLHVTTTHVINPTLLKTPYDAVKDFAPVATVVNTETLLVINNNVPAQNVQELIALAKAKPGQINFASSGSGTTNHLAMEFFCILASIKMQHIPHKGAGPAVTDLIGGGVQVFTNNALPLTPFVKSGRMRAIAVTSARRALAAPEIPTVAESGYPGFEAITWYGMFVPAGTPVPIIARLNAETVKVLGSAEFRDWLVGQGAEPTGSTPEELGAYVKSELVKYAKIIKDSGMRPE
jgi:tripartite-type tricarboxylate transporter receptor subunit TctC